MNDKTVWSGDVALLNDRSPPVMHPGVDASIDIEINAIAEETSFRGTYGYVVPFDGYRNIFLFDHEGIHYTSLQPDPDLGTAWRIAMYGLGPLGAKVSCAGPIPGPAFIATNRPKTLCKVTSLGRQS
ncbi:MAG: hypothetical protein GY791_01970 [Alphaproteobacteria bacterium]|nr:hypothetical protein [Alphaproteobacteria bacterium]